MKFSFTKSWTVILTLLALTFSAIGVTPAHAASLVVNSLLDTVGVDGKCTLREAIQNANANAATNTDCVAGSGADTITFSVSGTITLASTLPTITAAGGALTIDGTGKTPTISGNNLVGVMRVGVSASLTLNKETIANGSALNGGGIYNLGTLVITNSTFSGNRSEGTFVNPGYAGGIFNDTGGTLTITNSTFSGNRANFGFGGGIANFGTATIINSTFSGNSAPNGAGAGAGIHRILGTVTLRNTIVTNSVGGNCGGTITNGGNNIDDGTTCGWVSASGSMRNTNPLLGALANNGGPTQTFALLAGSPAIDGVTVNGSNFAPLTDQRGITRPQGARYDIGSYEFTPTKVNLPWLLLLLGD